MARTGRKVEEKLAEYYDRHGVLGEIVKGPVEFSQNPLAPTARSAEVATRAFLSLCGSWDDLHSAREIAKSIWRSR